MSHVEPENDQEETSTVDQPMLPMLRQQTLPLQRLLRWRAKVGGVAGLVIGAVAVCMVVATLHSMQTWNASLAPEGAMKLASSSSSSKGRVYPSKKRAPTGDCSQLPDDLDEGNFWINREGIAEITFEDCNKKPDPVPCSKPGENCSESWCCAWGGMQCYEKDRQWASCKNSCVEGPDFTEEKYNSWSCKELGRRNPGEGKPDSAIDEAPSWVKDSCAKAGEDCSSTKCCAEAGHQCYRKNQWWASCKATCEPGPDFNEEKFNQWSCEELGTRTPGVAEKEPMKDVTLPDWVEKHCAADGEDCSKKGCCAAPGTRCYQKTEGWATCRTMCTPGPDFTDQDGTSWTCKQMGPRTPGIVHKPTSIPSRFLPDWVSDICVKVGEDCRKSKCCSEPNMRCYEKDDTWGTCKASCFAGHDPMDTSGGNWSCKALGPKTPPSCPTCASQEPIKPDVVIPFFERDLCKLKYTARSLAVNDPEDLLGDVYLAWVSQTAATQFQDQINEIISLISAKKKVQLVDFYSKVMEAEPPPAKAGRISGWHAQQIVKLKMASVVTSDFYIVLDAKDTIIRPVQPDTFFTPCNQAIIQAQFPVGEIPAPHSGWYEHSARALKLRMPTEGAVPASITPAAFHRVTVLELLAALEEDSQADDALCNGGLCEKLAAFGDDKDRGATEFTLYTLFAMNSDKLKCIHSIEEPESFQVEYGKHWLKDFEAKLRTTKNFPQDVSQVEVDNKDMIEFGWKPTDESWYPDEDQFPLTFRDHTKKWSASLFRSEEEAAEDLEGVNLNVLKNVVKGFRRHPIVFGAQAGALSTMGPEHQKEASKLLQQLYKQANLYNGTGDDLVGCVVGEHQD